MSEYGLPGAVWFLIGIAGMVLVIGGAWAWACGLLDQRAGPGEDTRRGQRHPGPGPGAR